MFSHFCLITFRSSRQLIQNQLHFPHGWVLQLLVNLHPCVSIEFQCILTSNEFESEYSHFDFHSGQVRSKKLGIKNYFWCSQYFIIQSVDLCKDLCYFVTSIQWVLQILWGGVDESTVLMVDQVAQAVIVLGLQAGQVHHFVTDIRWVDVLLQASQTTSGVRANVVLVWASSCCSNDLFYYMYEWLPVCMFVQYP